MHGPAKHAANPTNPRLLRSLTELSLAARVLAVAAILCLDKSLLNLFVDFDAAQAATGAGSAARVIQHFGLRFLVTVAIALALLVYVRPGEQLRALNSQSRGSPFRVRWLALHFFLIALEAPLLSSLYDGGASDAAFVLHALVILVLAAAAVLALLAAAAPLGLWGGAARALGASWIYAIVAAAAATAAIQLSQMLWTPTAKITFELVRALLQMILPTLQADPVQLIVSTDSFAVQVSEVCSGLEGLGLMLAFCSAWLIFFRREYIFPRALLLIPIGLLLIFGLNVLRIAALVLLGDAGFPEIAELGFHSQAGWIAFNGASCAIVLISRRISWLSHTARTANEARGENPTAAFLMPLIMLLGAGMLARALSGGFEFLYGLRVLAAVAALVAYRRQLKNLDWSFGWQGPLAGIAVFLVWMVGQHLVSTPAAMPLRLASSPEAVRVTWIAVRFATASILVPIVEELAYRGFLLRRLASPEFEAVPFRSVGIWPLLVSSALFGLGHGAMLVPAILAGLAYGGVLMRSGRFGDAVVAHAVTNFMLAVCVLVFDQWQLW
jgi:exosortase E/protease (VPEID-CTERM system)